jgi:translocation and assembly module TamB
MSLDEGVAYGETFETASAGLRFEGNGVRLDAIEVRKGVGEITGAAFVGWDGTYSFNADGRQIAIESLVSLSSPRMPLSGQLAFSVSGSGAFAAPRYEVRGRIDDLFLADEGIGQVTGRLSVRDGVLTLDQLEVASTRLAISGSGQVALTPEADGELVFRFQETSLDPYVRAFRPGLSPFTTAVVSGSLRVFGELRSLERVRAIVVIDQADLDLFDYRVRNDGDVRLSLSDQTVSVDRLRLVGDGTELDMAGEVRLAEGRMALRALGDANLGIFQGVLRDIRSSGDAELQAEIRGTLETPIVLGALVITNGRLRHFAFPHGLESINGRVEFDAAGLQTRDLTGRLGGGLVRIDGRLAVRGLAPTEYNVTAVGEGLRLRYPEGFRSLIDVDLALRGDFFAPVLTGTVNVRNATLERTFDTGGTGLFGFAGGGAAGRVAPPAPPSRIPIRFDVRLLAPSTLHVENRVARLVSSAELTLRGTYDRPLLFGRVEIDRGEVLFEGNRYQVTSGTVDFINPTRIEPLFDIEAETRARVPGQIYRVVARVAGTPDRFSFDLSSDPPLATVDILALLFGDVRDPQNAELRALRSPQQAEQELLRAGAARLLASPISSGVGRVVEEAIGVDSVQITPLLSDLSAQESSRLTPSARLTVGKRISDRVYLTYSRALNATTRDEIILLEFNQSDRLSWIVSQNEDRTYALDVRVRRVF